MTVALSGNFLVNARSLTFTDTASVTWAFNTQTNSLTATSGGGGGGSSANPSATIGLSAVNGSASTFMTSDSAPPLSQAITPTWTNLHTFTGGVTITSGGTLTIDTYTLSLTANASLGGTNTGDQTNVAGSSGSCTGNAATATTATNVAAGLAGSVPYQTGAGATSLLAIGTAGYYLTVNAGATAPQWSALPAYPAGANPSATIGLTANNGSAATFMRSDATPALGVGIAPTWTGAHTWSSTATFNGTTSFASATNLAVTFSAAAASYTVLEFEQNSVINGYVGVDKGGSLITGSSSGDLCITPNAGALRLGYNNGTGTALSVSSAGLVTTPLGLTATTAVTLGAAASNTVGFYGMTPAAQTASNSSMVTSNVSSVLSTVATASSTALTTAVNATINAHGSAIIQNGKMLQQVINVLQAIGIYATH